MKKNKKISSEVWIEIFTFLGGFENFKIITNLSSSIYNYAFRDGIHVLGKIKIRFKNLKLKSKTIKKKDVYMEEITDRLYSNVEKISINEWFDSFDNSILRYYKEFFDDQNNFSIYADVTEKRVSMFIKEIFKDDSVFSLVFSEVTYITRPSNEFLKFYDENGYRNTEKPFVINILDTMGITHLSEEKSSIENEIDSYNYFGNTNEKSSLKVNVGPYLLFNKYINDTFKIFAKIGILGFNYEDYRNDNYEICEKGYYLKVKVGVEYIF